MTSASEGGLARRVSMPSVNNQSNNDHTHTPQLRQPSYERELRFHSVAKASKPKCYFQAYNLCLQ